MAWFRRLCHSTGAALCKSSSLDNSLQCEKNPFQKLVTIEVHVPQHTDQSLYHLLFHYRNPNISAVSADVELVPRSGGR